jgi:ATP-dependent Clp protease ATP-binding subunit ClpC
MFEHYTEPARLVVAAAQEEARTLRHDHIGTEHLLLGVLHQDAEPGARALAALGVGLGDVRAQVVRIVGLPEEPSPAELSTTPAARDALRNALREAIELGGTRVGPEHVLLAALRERDGVAVRVLLGLGTDQRRVREAVRQAVATATATAEPREDDAAVISDATGAYVLLGLLAAEGPAATLLRAHGIDEEVARRLLRDH